MNKIKNFFRYSQKGFILSTLLLILLVLGSAAGTYIVLDRMNFGQDQPDPFDPGASEVLQYVGHGCWWTSAESDPYGEQSGFINSGNVWECPQSMQLAWINTRAGKTTSGDSEFRMAIYEWDSIEEELGTLLGYSANLHTNQIDWRVPDEILPICSFNFKEPYTDEILLFEGEEYVFVREWEAVTGSGTTIMAAQGWGIDDQCEEIYTLGVYKGGNYQDASQYEWELTGFVIQEPQVVTIASEIRTDGSVWLTGWCDVFGEMEVGFFISDTESIVTSGQGVWVSAGQADLNQPRYYFSSRVVSILSAVTYYYRAAALLDSKYYYGLVKSFQRLSTDIIPKIHATVIINTLDLVEFETDLIGVPDATSWNITIYYGTTITIVDQETNSITVATGVTADGVWYTETSPTLYTYGGKYYFRACADEDLGTTICSDTKSFIAYDPSQPAFLNWLVSWIGLSFNAIWWAIAFIGMFIVWLIAAATRWWWVGLIGTAILLIVLITFGFVNPWVVVVLVIIVGWIIFKLIFKHSGGTG